MTAHPEGDQAAALASLRLDEDRDQRGVRRWKIWIPILVLVVAAAVILTTFGARLGAPSLETLTVPPPSRPQSDVLMTATGYVVARRKAAVGAKIPGRLATLGVEEGSTIRKGEVIARLESADLEAALRQSEASAQSARADLVQAQAEQVELDRELARQKSLMMAEISPRAIHEAADAAAESGRARMAALRARIGAEDAAVAYARAMLDNASVLAPFDGVVLTKDAEVGESVAPAVGGGGTTRGSMVTMADMDSLEVEADVSEANIGRLELGMPAEIVLDAFPDRPYPAIVHQIVPTADRQKATVQVKVRFTGDRAGALPEMSAKVSFLKPSALTRSGPRNLITLPASSVRLQPGGGMGGVVLVVREGVVAEVPVSLASAPREGQAEVASGLQGGEEILLSPPAGLKTGAKVRLRKPGGR